MDFDNDTFTVLDSPVFMKDKVLSTVLDIYSGFCGLWILLIGLEPFFKSDDIHRLRL